MVSRLALSGYSHISFRQGKVVCLADSTWWLLSIEKLANTIGKNGVNVISDVPRI